MVAQFSTGILAHFSISIYSFKTIDDVIELAKQVFRLRFTGEWEFYVESPYNKYSGKLEINV